MTNEAKVAVYNSLVLSILLFGCESWSLTQRLRNKLRTFHRGCVRDMCRLNMWHVQQYRITAQDLEKRLCIRSFETYLVRRRLRWLRHVRRMPWHRLPRKLLTSWVCSPWMAGGAAGDDVRSQHPRGSAACRVGGDGVSGGSGGGRG
jgi:hypothetical protein